MAAPSHTILLTGANGGLGTAIVKAIVGNAKLSAQHHGLYTVRDPSTATSLRSTLRAASSSHSADVVSLDLSNLSSVRETAATINAKVAAGEIPRIRALILNAAHRDQQGQTQTGSGLDLAFAINYLGHWLLVLLLLKSMDRQSGRVVVLGSWVHDPLDDTNKVSGAFENEKWKKILADTSSETVKSIATGAWSPSEDPSKDRLNLGGIRRYGASKLCIVMIIIELQRRLNSDPELSGISVLGVDPGLMPTKLNMGGLGWLKTFLFTLVMYIAAILSPNGTLRSTAKSASDVLAAAVETRPPFGDRPKGLYMNGSEPKDVSVEAKDAEKRASVWRAAVQYTELKQEETCLVDWA
ncbi:NAD(P)-binding protein [Cryphonectria parasitica EP155]|uniref:3beta-hydroxysteroid 3-dehydrogenase n=1 Tax=Cryphonectria parasitica (strain ATCC 38755 / EP155) TaxID=660469 RepID=A0A9P4XSG7_CRYP1|nr:NAD(P)-binding protein [Cryphonectria parasitica EP155]KAF3760402.1 NAD(P)-binding protein [Cryphonectria parasitica EP155]